MLDRIVCLRAVAIAFLAFALYVPAGAQAHFPGPPAPGPELVSAGGSHSCGTREDGTLACWGDDSAGQLEGIPTGQFLSVSAGGTHTCAIRTDSTLACWGDDSAGQLEEVPTGEFIAVSAGGSHTCAIRTDSTLACWGDDSAGQLEDIPDGKFVVVSAGGAHTCALRPDGDLRCWGGDSAGQVSGAPDEEHHSYWFWFWFHHHRYEDDPDFVAVAAGAGHTCAIGDDNELSCWGDDSAGQLEDVPTGEFLSVSAGGTHTCAIRADSTLACWGDDSAGQLEEVPTGEFASVSAGGRHSCAIRSNGEATCWGSNEGGRSQPELIGPEPAEGTVGTPYLESFETSPEAPAPLYDAPAGNLPPGLALTAEGTLTGTPTQAGTFSFTVTAANGVVADAGREVTLAIAEPPPPPPAPQAQVVQPGLPPPTAGANFNIDPVQGTVNTKCPSDSGFVNLPAPAQLPLSCSVDTSNGVASLTTSQGLGAGTQSAYFWGGVFTVSQSGGENWITGLRLGGKLKCERRKDSAGARTAARAGASISKRGKSGGRKLWGSGKGNYETSGNYGSATVRGTVWLVRDRCDNSTLFGVREGVVAVDDFVKGTTISLYPGQTYVAKASIPRLH